MAGTTVTLPRFSAASFVASRVTGDDAKQVYQLLIDNGMLDNGALSSERDPETDLSFLFPDADKADKLPDQWGAGR